METDAVAGVDLVISLQHCGGVTAGFLRSPETPALALQGGERVKE